MILTDSCFSLIQFISHYKESLKLRHQDTVERTKNHVNISHYGSQKRIKRTVTVDCHKESKKHRNNCLGNLINDGTLVEQFFSLYFSSFGASAGSNFFSSRHYKEHKIKIK